MAQQTKIQLNTVGRLAQKLSQPLHRITYLLRTRRIQPAAYAGQLRLYGDDVLPLLRRELNTIDARRASYADAD